MLLMKKIAYVLMFSCSSIALANNPATVTNADTANWKTLPNHADLQYAVMAGKPETNGMFIVWLKLPKDYTDVIHSHSAVRYDTIIAGNYFMTAGDKIDKENAKPLVAGDFIKCAPNVKHAGYTNDGAIIQIAGMGPWEVLKSSGKNR